MKRATTTLVNGKSGYRMALGVEAKVIDSVKGLVEYVASDESLDSYREIVRAEGWRFDRFQKNAPLVDSHDYSTIEKLVGKVVDFAVKGKRLVETAQWAVDVQENKLAQIGWKMTEAGYLRAVSVGFYPVKYLSRWDSDPNGYWNELAAMGMKKDDPAAPRVIYLEQQQIELSVCIIGANPNALARAYKAGVLDDGAIDFIDQEQTKRIQTGAADGAADAASVTRQPCAYSQFLRRFERALERM